jgi:hypothetical protein
MTTIFIPETTQGLVNDRLRRLTRILAAAGVSVEGGLLGGVDGYGADFSNDVFAMRQYRDADCSCGRDHREDDYLAAHPHSVDCYQVALAKIRLGKRPSDEQYRKLCEDFGIPWDGGRGCAVHCTCGRDTGWAKWREQNPHAEDCAPLLPNFKAGAFEARWYKWIGRDLEVSGPEMSDADLSALFDRCEASVRELPGAAQ